jgi:FMN-dependent NADH-azoreductase
VANLLHLDSSARMTGSITRQLTAEFAALWTSMHADGHITYRELATGVVPHLSDETLGAMFVPPSMRSPTQAQATALQEELIAELALADAVVIGEPMYNFNIPSSLKAWIDHVVIFGRTVGQSLFENTHVVIITGRGGAYGPGTPREPYDFQELYLRAILGLIGLQDITFIHAEMRAAATGDPDLAPFIQFASDSLATAQSTIAAEAARSAAEAARSAAAPVA